MKPDGQRLQLCVWRFWQTRTESNASDAKLKTEEAKGHTLLFTGSNDPSLYVKVPSGNYMVMAYREGHVIKKGHGGFETWNQYGFQFLRGGR